MAADNLPIRSEADAMPEKPVFIRDTSQELPLMSQVAAYVLLSKDLEKSLPQSPFDSPTRPSVSPLPSFNLSYLLLLWRKSGCSRGEKGTAVSSDRQ